MLRGLVALLNELPLGFPGVRRTNDEPVYPVLGPQISGEQLKVTLGLRGLLTRLFQLQGDERENSQDGNHEQGYGGPTPLVTQRAPGTGANIRLPKPHHGERGRAQRQGWLVLVMVVVLTWALP
jgi:hypothetical protein